MNIKTNLVFSIIAIAAVILFAVGKQPIKHTPSGGAAAGAAAGAGKQSTSLFYFLFLSFDL